MAELIDFFLISVADRYMVYLLDNGFILLTGIAVGIVIDGGDHAATVESEGVIADEEVGLVNVCGTTRMNTDHAAHSRKLRGVLKC